MRENPGHSAEQLELACKNGELVCVRALLYAGAWPQTGSLILHRLAARSPSSLSAKHAACLELLLARGMDADSRDEFGRTPLHIAGSVAAAFILIRHGADVNACDDDGHTPLFFAPRPILSLLLRHNADVHAVDMAGRTCLHALAARETAAKDLPLLLAAGAQVNARDAQGRTPLSVAAVTQPRNVSLQQAFVLAGGVP